MTKAFEKLNNYLAENLDYEKYSRDMNMINIGASIVGLIGFMLFGKSWFKKNYSKKGIAIGLSLGVLTSIVIAWLNCRETKEDTKDIEE